MAGRVKTVVGLVGGALVGWLVAPWWAVMAGLAPWWAPLLFYVATGPTRWTRWVLAGAWEESQWDPEAVGDDGAAVGVLQYHARSRTGEVRPSDRKSACMSAVYAPALTLAHLYRPQLRFPVVPFLALRLPVYGYLVWRDSWRTGRPLKDWGEPLGDRARTQQALQGLTLNVGLALVCALLAAPFAGGLYAWRGQVKRWWRRVGR